MKRVLILLTATAVIVLMFASAALAEQHGGATATPTATTAATAQYAQYATPLPPTGGPSLAAPFALVAALALMGSGVAALVFLRRSTG
jgi:hypothetical protein